MTDDTIDVPRAALRVLKGELLRSRETLVPPAFTFLWQLARFIVAYGGRASAKSWSIARVLLMLAYEAPLRILCCREIQGSIKESAYRLLADQITLLQLDDFFEVQSDSIIGRNGSRFYFEGLRYNASKIRSYEGVDLVWVEEAQAVSELSWETLLPTIRKRGSRIYISFNPMTRDDPVARRFVDNTPPNTIVRKVSYLDNPHLSPEADSERAWLERTDPDAYRHVWLGEPRTVSDALILRGKYAVEPFEVDPAWAGPYHGCDFGFARDPSAAVRCFIDDATRTLYVTQEFWRLACDIDALPGALEAAIPGLSRHVLYCDAARPETVSYLARNGIPNARSAEKWPGSVDDGLAYLRVFSRIVIDPSCKHLIDEAGSYSFKTDRLTGVPLPEPEDKNNHLIDSLRYALSPLIRNLPAGGYFSRSALLVNGEPMELAGRANRATRIFVTLAICERPGTAVGVVFWARYQYCGYSLRVVGYDLVEFDQAFSGAWLASVFARAREFLREWDATDQLVRLWAEEGQLYETLRAAVVARVPLAQRPQCDVNRLEGEQMKLPGSLSLPPSLDERANLIRSAVNGGSLVKVARSAYVQQVTQRSVTANHLVGQLLSYRPGAKDAAAELVGAFTLGCLTVLSEATRVRAPEAEASTVTLDGPAGALPAAPSPPLPQPGVRLRAGRHTIDGVTVDIPGGPGESAWHPLPRWGKYVVDSKIFYATDPAVGFRVA